MRSQPISLAGTGNRAGRGGRPPCRVVVIQQVFAVGMSLHSTATLAAQPEVRKPILAAADGLDQALWLTRDTVFGLERHLQGRGLRAEIVALCDEISPVPEVSFTGPVDGALAPVRAVQLAQTLRDALAAISPHSAPNRVSVTASGSTYTAEIETAGSVPDGDLKPAWLARLKDSSAEAGFGLSVQPAASGIRLSWSIPSCSMPSGVRARRTRPLRSSLDSSAEPPRGAPGVAAVGRHRVRSTWSAAP
jgi:hypothetical protein